MSGDIFRNPLTGIQHNKAASNWRGTLSRYPQAVLNTVIVPRFLGVRTESPSREAGGENRRRLLLQQGI